MQHRCTTIGIREHHGGYRLIWTSEELTEVPETSHISDMASFARELDAPDVSFKPKGSLHIGGRDDTL